MESKLTLGPMSLKCGILQSQLRKLVRDRLVPFELVKLGTVRILFDSKDVPAVRAAAVKLGYLQPEAVGAS